MNTDDLVKATGRRAQLKAERRAAILDIALRCFLEHGYERTSLSAIAEAMGGSKATLWKYFRSKEELFEAAIDSAAIAFRGNLTAALDPSGDPRSVLEHFAARLIATISSPASVALQRVIISECGRAPELSAVFFSRARTPARRLLAAFLSGRMDGNVLRKADSDEAANLLFDLCSGELHQRILWGVDAYDPVSAEQHAVASVDHFLQIYGAS